MQNILERLSQIQQKIEHLKKLDTNFSIFGSKEHQYKLNPVLSEEGVRKFEEKYKVQLPEEYRSFIIYVANGGVGPSYGLYSLDQAYEHNPFLDLKNIDKPFPFEKSWGCNRKDFEENYSRDPRWQEYDKQGLIYDVPSEIYHYDPISLDTTGTFREGIIMLNHMGSGYFNNLVITGPQKGTVWQDYMTSDEGIFSTGKNFLEWYEGWLDYSISQLEQKK